MTKQREATEYFSGVASNVVNEEQLLKDIPGLTSRQVGNLRRARKIPFLKLGHRSYLYERDRVLKALKKLEVST
jgi:hypothetical protein